MATTQLATVKIDELSKFGFKSNGEYINWSKTLKDDQKVNVVPGRTFQMELYVADSGKKYVNKVVNQLGNADVPVPKRAKATAVAPVSVDAPMTRTDWDAKDRRISRQGMLQACLQAVASQSTLEDLFDNAVKLADKGLEYVNRQD